MASFDTIYAFATPPGRSGVAVLRISGPEAGGAMARLMSKGAPPRSGVTRRIHDPASGEIIDQALVLWMPGPASFTGEDILELHLHGGIAIRQAALAALSRLAGLRPAEPGEYVRRAFLAGRLDLTEVEGLADLINAETEAQRRQALFQSGGALRAKLEQWREELLSASALLEASLDFSDEELPDDLLSQCGTVLSEVQSEMEGALAGVGASEVIRNGFRVVLTGAPNAGKSSLLNALAQRDVAIVSPVPGTTRDVIEVRCDVGGHLVIFTDTAGLRDSEDAVEKIGIARARAALEYADLVLALRDCTAGLGKAPDLPRQCDVLTVWTKVDLAQAPHDQPASIAVSAVTGQGLDVLFDGIRERIVRHSGPDDALLSREHHRHATRAAAEALARGRGALERRQDVLAAEDVRIALRCLATITGRAGVDDMLDQAFGRFCIGK